MDECEVLISVFNNLRNSKSFNIKESMFPSLKRCVPVNQYFFQSIFPDCY